MTNDERQEPPVIPPAIEPLSDTAWARVERGVWSRLDADAAPAAAAVRGSPWRSWRPVWAPLAAAAVIALVIGVVHDSPERAPLGEPSRAVSGASPSTISFGDVHIELDPQTALGMSHETGQPIASLERGAAWFTVAPRGDRPAVLVRAGDATVRVIGTRFRVARSDERITVSVEHGVVDIAYRGDHRVVSTGGHWASDGEPPTAAPAPAAADPVAPAPAAADPVAPAAVAPAPAVSAPLPRSHVLAPAPSAPSPGAPAASALPSTPPGLPTGPVAHRAFESAADRDQAEYDRLTALEAQSSERAIAGYLALSRTAGPWAGPALFAAARLAADRGDRRAAALLDTYLKRFPAGANAADARALRARLAP